MNKPIVPLLFALLTNHAMAQDLRADQIIYSQSWAFLGHCDGSDQVKQWKITDGPAPLPTSWYIAPWLDNPITLRGVELVKTFGGRTKIWFAGNNIVGDAMVFCGPGEDHCRRDFPSGLGMPMMDRSKSEPNKHYVDLHGSCEPVASLFFFTKPVAVQIIYTLYYTLDLGK
jgi:hypothetical protein